MTYNDLKRLITNKKRRGNDLQQARNDLKRPTMSQTQPITTQTYLQQAKKGCEMTNNKQIFRLFYSMGQLVLFCNMFSTQDSDCFRFFLACCRSLQVVSGCFLLVVDLAGCFRLFLCSLQVVVGCFRLFWAVSHFSKCLRQLYGNIQTKTGQHHILLS